MSVATAIAPTAVEIHALVERLLAGGAELTAAEARALLEVVPGSPAMNALLAGARRLRDQHHGTRVQACSILNAKAGGCSENCTYCAQASGSANDQYDKHRWLEPEDITAAAASAAANGAGALGLVAAWKGVREGRQLDMVCESIRALSQDGKVRADVNLGILESQRVADRLKEAGARVYGHNLETARSFFPETCSSHSFDERLRTIGYIKAAGMGLCSGGIIGMGESRDQRIEFFEQLRFIEPNMVPINFLNPLPGTPLAGRPTVPADEALVTLATLRLFIPAANIMVAGGKEITFGDRLAEVLDAGINAIMVGNYLTTLGTDPAFWQSETARRGLTICVEGDSCGH